MLLVPSSIPDLHDLNASARNFCAKPLRAETMQFAPFMFCCCWSAFRIVDVSAADHIPQYTAATHPRAMRECISASAKSACVGGMRLENTAPGNLSVLYGRSTDAPRWESKRNSCTLTPSRKYDTASHGVGGPAKPPRPKTLRAFAQGSAQIRTPLPQRATRGPAMTNAVEIPASDPQ